MRFEEKQNQEMSGSEGARRTNCGGHRPRFKAHLAEYMTNGNRSMVLDLAAVTFIDSSGLGALVSSLKSMGTDGDLVVSGARGAVASVFKLTRMDKVFRMYENNDIAVAALS